MIWRLRFVGVDFFYYEQTNMNATVWGCTMWDVLFAGAFRLPPRESVDMLEALAYVLPCVHCRSSYAHYLQRNPVNACMRSERDVAKWLWAIRDLVNVKLDRPSSCVPFSIVETRHAVFTNACSSFDPIDMLALMALQLESVEQADAYARITPHFLRIYQLTGGLPFEAPPLVYKPCDMWKHACATNSAARLVNGFPVQNSTQFCARYEMCRAPRVEATKAPTVSRSTKSGITLKQLRMARGTGKN